MKLITMIISLPISVGLLIWIIRMKKDDPFPKGTVIKALLFGALSGVVSAFIYIAYTLFRLIQIVGIDSLTALFNDPENSAMSFLDKLQAAAAQAGPANFLSLFISTFLLVGLVEEIMKFLFARGIMKKPDTANTWFDTVLVVSLVGLGFQIWEDLSYAGGDVISAIVRALTPFHFVFAVIMGYWYGKARVKKNAFYTFLAILVPSLIHTLYDASINMTRHNEDFIILVIITTIGLLVLFILEILWLRKWYKMHMLNEKIGEAE